MGSLAIESDLHDFLTALTDAETIGAAWEKTVAFMRRLGADHLHMSMDMDQAEPTLLWTTPAWITEQYLSEVFPLSDPTITHCRHKLTSCFSGTAFMDRDPTLPPKWRSYLADLETVEWRSAVLVPIHCSESGDWGRFSFGTGRDADGLNSFVGEHGQTARLVGTHAFNKIRTLMVCERAEEVGLTEAERKCLIWVASGLFTKEVGERLGIGAMIATRNLESACAKLGAKTIDEALGKAFRLGLVTPREVS